MKIVFGGNACFNALWNGERIRMKEKERVRLEYNLYRTGLCLPGIAMLLWGIQAFLPAEVKMFFSIPCLFHAFTGYYCPGCGGTRAAACLLRGKVAASFLYHPVVPYCAVLYLCFMVTHTAWHMAPHRVKAGMRYRNAYLWGMLFIVLFHTAVKNIALAAFGIDLLTMLDRLYFN